jgi:hypothetical protein
MRTLHKLLTISALALVACSGAGDKTSSDAGSERDGEAETEPEPSEEVEDGAVTPVGPVPLTLWVDDLIDHHTTNFAEPDTVDDKIITDDTDETSFDKYLP